MSLGWHVALERDLPAAQAIAVDGKALVFRQHDLDEIAERLKVPGLTEFLSVDPAAMGQYLRQQGLDPDSFPIPDEEWFEPAEGLATVRGLLAHLRADAGAVLDSFRIVRDLAAIEQILTLAAQEQIHFHLASTMPTTMPGDEEAG